MRHVNVIYFRTLGLALVCAGLVSMAEAKNAEFQCSDATKAGTVEVKIEVQPYGMAIYPIPIPGPMPAEQKRDTIYDWFVTNQPQIQIERVGADSFVIQGLKGGTYTWFSPGTTGEGRDRVAGAGTPSGTIAFSNAFEPFDATHQPAIFTAGIVTDVGELSASISSAELNFQTEGPIICQALFQRLAPRAPQYGAQINFAGDRLEVYFDPAYSVVQGGVIFGTTSSSPGCTGTILLGPDPVDNIPPTLEWAGSSRTHGAAGELSLSVELDEALAWTIEPRAGGPGRIILGFSEPIDLSGTAQLSMGSGSVTVIGNQMMIDNISGVPDGTCLTININVADLAGNPLAGNSMVRLGVLAGDVDRNGSVDLGDALATKGRIGRPASQASFLYDLTCNGIINLSDALLARSRMGGTLAYP